jgi:hypothetical protein
LGSPADMSLIRRKKSKQQQATDWLTTVLKVGAVGAAARGAGQATKKGAKKGAKTAAAKGGRGLGKRVLPLAAIGTAAFVVLKRVRSRDEQPQSFGASPNGSPTPVAPPEPATRP